MDEYQPFNGRYSSIHILEDCTTIFRFLSKQSLIKGSFYQNLTTAIYLMIKLEIWPIRVLNTGIVNQSSIYTISVE
jgi:hypothetical protein